MNMNDGKSIDANAGKNTKKRKAGAGNKGIGTIIKELLFAYLAVTKIMYWMNTFAGLDGFGEFGYAFLDRMIGQDIVIIIILIAMFILDGYFFRGKSDKDVLANIKLFSMGLIVFLVVVAGYTLLIGLFFEMTVNSWPQLFIDFTVSYVIIYAFVFIKDMVKKKQAEKYALDTSTDEAKIAMLKSLCNAGVLTQEECDEKCSSIGGSEK